MKVIERAAAARVLGPPGRASFAVEGGDTALHLLLRIAKQPSSNSDFVGALWQREAERQRCKARRPKISSSQSSSGRTIWRLNDYPLLPTRLAPILTGTSFIPTHRVIDDV
jgi:hypothetical protein